MTGEEGAGEARQQVAERGLTAPAVNALIPLMGGVDFEALGEVKALLKRFFSPAAWTSIDAAALARAVGPPPDGDDRVVRHAVADDLVLVAGWVDGGFAIDVESEGAPSGDSAPTAEALDLGATFRYGVVPQPTPNPRTIRFATGRRATASGSHRQGDGTGDEGVAALFAVDGDVVDVLVGADFVAVSVRRPDRWPALLEPALEAVAAHFTGVTSEGAPEEDEAAPAVDVRGVTATPRATTERHRTRLDRAWDDLADLHADRPEDLDRVLAATSDTDAARRQVAARLLVDAPPDAARAAWTALAADPSRAVRRATLDAMVDAGREDLRPLLERALTDADAWTRWKALHGLVELGAGASLPAIAALDDDPDFRVRLEAANARRTG